MTDKQKEAIMLLMDLYNKDHIHGKEYFLLLECVIGDSNKELKEVRIPFVQWQPQCCEPNGVCTNPFHDCINCTKQFGSGGTTITTTDDQIARPHKHFGFDIGDPKGDIGIKEEQQ